MQNPYESWNIKFGFSKKYYQKLFSRIFNDESDQNLI